MRKFFVLFALTVAIVSANKPLPPVPTIGGDLINKTEALKNCKVPPQIAILPPQIEKDYRECVNAYYTPSFLKAEKALKKKGFLDKNEKLLKIQRAPSFIRAYEFIYETSEKKGFFVKSDTKVSKTLVCDDTITKCYKVEGSL